MMVPQETNPGKAAAPSPWLAFPMRGSHRRNRAAHDCALRSAQVTCDLMAAADIPQLGGLLAAERQLADRAAGVKTASARGPQRVRYVALQRDAPTLDFGVGD